MNRSERYRERHPERARAAVRAYKSANLEKVKACQRAAAKKWRLANPEKARQKDREYRERNREAISARGRLRYSPERNRANKVRAKYGLTPEQDRALGYSCGICGRTARNKNRAIDHDHATGRVRGVLCGHCNLGLGHFRDSAALLVAAVEYVLGARP